MAPLFVIARNLMMGTPKKGDKSAIQIMLLILASFLLVIVSKKNKQT